MLEENKAISSPINLLMTIIILLIISDNQQKKNRNCWIMNFAFQANPRIKLKESEKRDKYLDLAKEVKKNYKGDDDTNCN